MARKGLRRRLQVTLALLVVAAAATAAVPFLAQRRVREATGSASHAEAGIAAVLRLSIAMRDAYAHQAHVVILNDTTHVEHYRETAHAMQGALAVAQKAVAGTKAEGSLGEVAADAEWLHRTFLQDVVPHVGGDRAVIIPPAEAAIVRMEEMQVAVDRAAALLAQDAAVARGDLQTAMTQSTRASAVFLIVAVVLALVSAIALDRAWSGPLARLEAATDALAKGDLRVRVADDIASRDDELGSLAARFNDMASRLAEREAKLLEAERLAAVGRMAAGVAHEINNPLGVILGNARLLEPKLDDEGKRDVQTIVAEVERCKDIVGGLLDLARPPRLRLGPVDLNELCRETADRLKSAGVDGVDVRCTGDVGIEADGEKLRQIMANLLHNAAQAGAKRVHINVDGSTEDDVRLSVRDDGRGVDQAIASRLFAAFATTKAEGTGLGLAVSRAIAMAHGGDLQFVATSKGARFDLVLPRHVHAAVGRAT